VSSGLDDFRVFLPKYLSAESQDKLFEELRSFPENISERFYSTTLTGSMSLYQGDGLKNLGWYNGGTGKTILAKGLVISNTCDISSENTRLFQPYLTFAPIWDFQKYIGKLKENLGPDECTAIDSHANAIRQQKITQFFYLPSGSAGTGESFARLDILQSIPLTMMGSENIESERIFSLSNYGFYMLVFKLSVHLSRIRDTVDRG
jgi:hypothetical protein